MDQMTPSNGVRWGILSLCALTVIVVYTIPTLMLPVLFPEIAADLNLDVVQLGIAWGSLSLSSIVVGLFGGAIADRLGSRKMITVVCLLTGLLGGLRGFAPNFVFLVGSLIIYGLVAPSFPPILHKTGAHLFPNQRGISTGVISLGFAFALFLGSRYTATLLSPLVGGWRNVLFMFGGLGVLFSAIWFLAIPKQFLPPPTNSDKPFFNSIFSTVQQVLKVREMWIIGIGSTLFWACFRGFTGYTPLYLRGLGLSAVEADNALSGFFLASLILALPLSFLAERLGYRRPFLVLAMLLTGGGVLFLGSGNEAWIPLAIIVAGLMFDAFMAIHQAEVLDLKGVGAYTGSALGLLVMFREIGGVLSPPIGNWMAQFNPSIPYFFWGGAALLAAIVFLLLPRRS
ncbi:MAG: MFS transporter [Chloroflexota bacterium]